MLNNINLPGLEAAKEAISKEPKAGIAAYGVQLDWQSGVRAIVKALPMSVGETTIERDFTWVVDEPPALLGESKGPTPQEYLMSGVGACIMVGFVVHSSIKNIELRSLKVVLRGSLDLAGFLNLRADAKIEMLGIQAEIHVDADADDAVLNEIRDAAVNFSPNAMTVSRGIPLSCSVTRA